MNAQSKSAPRMSALRLKSFANEDFQRLLLDDDISRGARTGSALTTLRLLLAEIVEDQVYFRIIAAVRALVVQAPVIRQVSGLKLLASLGQLLRGSGAVLREHFWYGKRFLEVGFEPFKDFGDLRLFFLGREFIQVFAREPDGVGLIALRFEAVGL